MGSTRLPGKMSMKLGKYTILEWVLRRLKSSKRLEDVILATTDSPKDDLLEKYANELGVKVFRGSESDVLGRFVAACEISKASHIVRICADNPFLDVSVIDGLISDFEKGSYDYGFNHIPWGENKFIDGVGAEIFTKDLLSQMGKNAKLPDEREHVTRFIWNNWKQFRILSPTAEAKFRFPSLSLDIDTLDDYELFNSHLSNYQGNPENYSVTTLISKLIA
ncbi:cytidyltransferase [Leptospira idonii]|uniref:Cytidyltransferase n=2 Tax=Leptospira idonii TaxID=1193500 RepID=A0A4R9LX09_9LEPT|nr:cytidyltransferase [Leptospira idonii]